MKATREQCLEMAIKTLGPSITDGIEGWQAEALVHLAQQFTLDQIRAKGAKAYGLQMPGEIYARQLWVVKDAPFESAMRRWPESYKGAYQIELFQLPETLE